MPQIGNTKRFLEGAQCFSQAGEAADYFENIIVESFVDKIHAGINVPNYPQFRDMNTMFFSMMDGIEKFEDSYIMTAVPSVKVDACQVPEVVALERNAKQIMEKKGEPFEARVCVTGPYTLASFFAYKDEQIFSRIGNVIAKILQTNLFSNKSGKTSLVSVDEPLFGLVDDPLIDFGSNGRADLLDAWETIFSAIKAKGAQTMIHLHSTTNELFWHTNSLQIIDSHVDDPLQKTKKTKTLLETTDKFLKASVTVNDFDKLIKTKITTPSLSESDISEKIADAWTQIKAGKINPDTFLDSTQTMKKRLASVVERFGENRILFAGPECGLKGYPTYQNAIECLKRAAEATTIFVKNRL
jgi:5-methyltetrahydropteroyltriglutamate--homocysteine methyltransferase